MDQHRGLLQQAQGAGLIRIHGGAPQQDRPATLHGQPRQLRLVGQDGVEGGEVGPQPPQDLGPNGGGQLEEAWGRGLHGRGDGEVLVGEEGQGLQGVPRSGATHRDPAELQLGQAGHLAEAREEEDGAGWRRIQEGRCQLVIGHLQGKVREDLVDEQGETAPGAQVGQFGPLHLRQEVPGGVVGVHQHHGPGPRRDGGLQGAQVQVPAVVEVGGYRSRRQTLQPRQPLEEGVAWAGHEHLVPRVAQQLEEQPVALAGGGREQQILGPQAMAVVGGDGLPCAPGSPGIRIVGQHGRQGERLADLQLGIGEAAARGVGDREIQDLLALGPEPGQRGREGVRLETLRQAGGEAHSTRLDEMLGLVATGRGRRGGLAKAAEE